MDWVSALETFASRDAGAEPTRMYLWRVSSADTQSMSRTPFKLRNPNRCLCSSNIHKKFMG